MFHSLHLASYEQAAALLPTPDLVPVRWVDGRAVVRVSAMRCREVGLHDADGWPLRLVPYGEVMIGPLVTRKKWPRGLPALLPSATRT